MIQIPEPDRTSISALMRLIEKISQTDNPAEFEKQLQKLTGKPEISVYEVLEYYEYSSLENLACSLLMPEPEKQNLSASELSEIITAVCECQYAEAETDWLLNVLKTETGRTDISDLIFYPEIDEIPAIIAKILGKA